MRIRVVGGGAVGGGQDWIGRMLERNVAIAVAHGHPVRRKALERELVPMFRSAGPAAASMLRDLEAGGRIKSDHILGFLLDAARHAGVDDALLGAAYLRAGAYEARRAAGRLPQE